jgi:putative FmdB family regulatory protein
MPRYDYSCNECELIIEVQRSFSETSPENCPTCGIEMSKVYGSVGVTFKGSGFYKTDNRQK